MKKLLLFTLMLVLSGAMFGQATAVWNPAANPASTGLWSEGANWSGGIVPTSADRAVFNIDPAVVCTVNGTAEAALMRLGEGGPGSLTVKSGSTLTLGTLDWTGIGCTGDAKLIVEAGASVTIDDHIWIGRTSGKKADVDIYGSVTGTQNIGLDRNAPGAIVNLTIYEGGLLSARYTDDANFGPGAHMDIRGGVFKFTQDELASVNLWITAGKIVGYGGTIPVEAILLPVGVGFHTIVTAGPYTAIADMNPSKFNVYPNPATNNVSIEFGNKVEALTMINVLGKTVYNKSNMNNAKSVTIDVSDFSKGIYFVSAWSKGQKTVKKIVIN